MLLRAESSKRAKRDFRDFPRDGSFVLARRASGADRTRRRLRVRAASAFFLASIRLARRRMTSPSCDFCSSDTSSRFNFASTSPSSRADRLSSAAIVARNALSSSLDAASEDSARAAASSHPRLADRSPSSALRAASRSARVASRSTHIWSTASFASSAARSAVAARDVRGDQRTRGALRRSEKCGAVHALAVSPPKPVIPAGSSARIL